MKWEKQTHNSCFPQIRMCLWCWSHIWCKWCIMSRTEIQNDQHRDSCTGPQKAHKPLRLGLKERAGKVPISHPLGLLWFQHPMRHIWGTAPETARTSPQAGQCLGEKCTTTNPWTWLEIVARWSAWNMKEPKAIKAINLMKVVIVSFQPVLHKPPVQFFSGYMNGLKFSSLN